MMQRNPEILADEQAREAALSFDSFIVEAPAGSGKTELITQRFLHLLAHVEAPEEIVALTFTKKATSEMAERILTSLREAALPAPTHLPPHKLRTRQLAQQVLAQDALLNWQLLSQPARLRIQTMDAFCASLTRQMPLLSRFGGNPNTIDDASACYEEAAQRTLAQVADEADDNAPISRTLAFLYNDSAKLTALLADMLAKRDQWLGHLHQMNDANIAAEMQAALQHLVRAELEKISEIITANIQQALMPIVRYAASNLPEDHELQTLRDWQTPLQETDVTGWQILINFLLKKNNEFYAALNKKNGIPADNPNCKLHNDTYLAVCEKIGNAKPLSRARQLPPIDLDTIKENSFLIQSFIKVLQLATAELWLIFQAENQVDFVEITLSAIRALRETDELAARLDYQIKHLLIDEFQDTNPTQIALLNALTKDWQSQNNTPQAERTLFCVGDPMQSIYRFRKADVSAFLDASTHGIGQIKLTPLKLKLNNRSDPSLVDWFNQQFSAIFPPQDLPFEAAIAYRACTATLAPREQAGAKIHPMVFSKSSTTAQIAQAEAAYIAQLIEQEHSAEPTQSIAVLVRSRGHLSDLVSTMRRNYPHLHFQAPEIEPLKLRQTVQDALSLTRAMLHRADRVHWLNLLRAPWCGLSLADLHTLCAHDHQSTIWQLLASEMQHLSTDGQTRAKRLQSVLKQAFNQQGRLPLRRWLQNTWLLLGGAETLLSPEDISDIEAFFDLIEHTAQGYALDFEMLEKRLDSLYAKPALLGENIQFKTIHSTKGLEFDCVILPALNAKTRHDDPQMLLWQEASTGRQRHLLAAPMSKNGKSKPLSIYQYLQSLEKNRAQYEALRLLYVAATRAKRALHLVGSLQENNEGELKPQTSSFLALIWPNVAQNYSNANKIGFNEYHNTDLSGFSSQLQRANLSEIALDFAPQPPFNPQTAPNNDNDAELQRDMGVLAHLYLEMLAKQQINVEKIAQAQTAMQTWLMQFGHSATQAQTAAEQIHVALQNTFASPTGAWLLSVFEMANAELALTDAQGEQHVIDLTFIENGTRWIIDYKLGLLTHATNAQTHAQVFVPQLARYRALFTHENLPIKTAILFLNSATLVEIEG